MNPTTSIVLRWIVAIVIFSDFSGAILKVVKENRDKGKPVMIKGYTPWSEEVLESAPSRPIHK